MSNGFDRAAWDRLAALFDGASTYGPAAPGAGFTERVPYAGYKPEVREAPNGDTKACPACGNAELAARLAGISHVNSCPTCRGTGRVPNVDAGPAGKRYLHVAEKYLAQHPGLEWPRAYLARAYYEICRVADALQVPDAYYPRPEDTTLRVLEYPSAAHRLSTVPGRCGCGQEWRAGMASEVCPALAPGAGTAEHTDADLFTIVCWRETPADLERGRAARGNMMGHSLSGFGGGPNDIPSCVHCGAVAPEPGSTCWGKNVLAVAGSQSLGSAPPERRAAEAISPGLHIGQIGELVGLGPATPHRVPARPYVQRSIVAFAMPRLDVRLPWRESVHASVNDVPTVREWIEAWKKRGRVYA